MLFSCIIHVELNDLVILFPLLVFPHFHFHLNNVSIFIRTLPLLVFALCLNGVGIGGEQVAGVVDALHEAV